MDKNFSPGFIIPGASRCGTTTLHSALSRHPGIFMPPEKELQFFYRDADYAKGPGFYQEYFIRAHKSQVTGEASPPYFEKAVHLSGDGKLVYDEKDDCAARIAKLYPDVKLIISLRNPVTRAYSIYWKNIWQGKESAPSFEQAIDEELEGKRRPDKDFMCLLWRNHYKTHLENWFARFPRQNILILLFEEWTAYPSCALRGIEAFLGIESAGMSDEDVQPKNEGRGIIHPALKPVMRLGARIPLLYPLTRRLFTWQGYPPMIPATKQKLRAIFEEDRLFIEQMTGRKITCWDHNA